MAALCTDFFALNYDVLSLVLALISVQDAKQLALVSHQAYALAMPRILADVSLGGAFHKPSSIPATRQLTGFCAFMLADDRERLPCLQSLEIRRDAVRSRVGGVWAVDSRCVELLSEVLARAVHLQKITIWSFDSLVTAYPLIVDALGGCARLQTVCLGGDIAPMSTLIRAFPHVRTLQFVDGRASWGPRWDTCVTPATGEAWPNLDHVESGFPVLPLAKPVRRVDIRNPLSAYGDHLENALDYIQATRPVVLSCVVDISVLDSEFIARLPEVACNLKYLELIIHGCESLATITVWMTRIAALLSPLPLLGLALYSSTPASFPSPFSSPAASPPSSPRLSPVPDAPAIADLSFAALDSDAITPVAVTNRSQPPTLRTIARDAASAIPSVRYVALQPAGPTTRNAYKPEWFVAERPRKGGAIRVRELGEREGVLVGQMLRRLDVHD
ncbi:uncharacterized protein FIBRA_07558 [Fibroporia radiculosa]|uniref:F-box domain-containing protein n=1 Tax=Fibroporia radiculosa TaxID=599839 RepID=J4H4P4_9APHY|nr:uncharacterized protein FIBRA_07558 [Fibroporia radiculosa]CCM05344.1 predicted protein [Fibroporia radiculosa]